MNRVERHLALGFVLLVATVLYVCVLPDAANTQAVAASYAVGVVVGFVLGRKIG